MLKNHNILLLLLIGFSTAKIYDVNIQPNIPPQKLTPDVSSELATMTETKWNINTATGSKLILDCMFYTLKCAKAKIKIYDGAEYFEICPEFVTTFRNVSVENFLTVTIDTAGRIPLAKCDVIATLQYYDRPDVEIDSSEHGLVKGAKRKTSCKCGWANKKANRIVGGRATAVNEFPFIVRLKEKYTMQGICGGSLITKRHVLTAAHCLFGMELIPIIAIVGEHDLTTRKDAAMYIDVIKGIIHEDYNNEIEYNDIAIVVLSQNVLFSQKVGPVCMPSKLLPDLAGQYIKVMGWGLTKDITQGGLRSRVLKKANLHVINSKICKAMFYYSPARQICTHSRTRDSCSGDSGGPLVIVQPESNMFMQVGIVSYGRKCASTDPGVNTNVAYYMQWIKNKIRDTIPLELCY